MYNLQAKKGDRVRTYKGHLGTVLTVDFSINSCFVRLDDKHTTGWFHIEKLEWINDSQS